MGYIVDPNMYEGLIVDGKMPKEIKKLAEEASDNGSDAMFCNKLLNVFRI